ncbi:MAG: PilN domain-containing protein [Planctomycetota bacterium]|jgi:hypothetical protein
MKEIDFLPEWYKSGRQRQIGYRTQVLGLGGILVIMIVWSFVVGHSISKAKAKVEQNKAIQAEAESVSREFSRIKSEVIGLRKKVKSMEEMDSKIDVASVLAEMSYLIDDNIVLSKVEFDTERLVDGRQKKASRNTISVPTVAGGNFAGKGALPLGDVRFKVTISGVAAGAGDIAELICKLEESPYFCLVYPSFSRSRKIKVGTGKNFQVSEFEISCYLANYREK